MSRSLALYLRILGWLGLGLLTLEMCSRGEDSLRYGAPFWGNYDNESLYFHDAQGKRGRPHASYLKWKLNEVGYRGPALRRGTYRVACIGASETFGLYESEGREWPRELERELNRPQGDAGIEVVNAAYPGLTLATSLRRVAEMMRTAQPQLVLVYPSYASYITIDKLDFRPGNAPPAAWEPRLQSRLRTLLKRAVPDGLQDRVNAYLAQRSAHGVVVFERLPNACVERFERDLEDLTRSIKSRCVEVVLITHATRFGAKVQAGEERFLTGWRKFYPMLREEGFLDMEERMSAAVRRVGERAGVHVVDAAKNLEPGPKHFVDFAHFNDDGARAIASLIAHDIAPMVQRQRMAARRPGPSAASSARSSCTSETSRRP